MSSEDLAVSKEKDIDPLEPFNRQLDAIDTIVQDKSEEVFQPLWKNPLSARKVIHALLHGKHVDVGLGEEFRFLETYPSAWEEYFAWMGYRLRRSELGGSPFYYLESATELARESRLSRGATFLGLYLAWHFFLQGPGEPDWVTAADLFRRLVSSYKFSLLRTVFVRRSGAASLASTQPMALSEDQAEKLRSHMRRELTELSRLRFIDLKPNPRAAWEDLLIHRLPALHRFWELALHVRERLGGEGDVDLDRMVEEVWGRVDTDGEEDEA